MCTPSRLFRYSSVMQFFSSVVGSPPSDLARYTWNIPITLPFFFRYSSVTLPLFGHFNILLKFRVPPVSWMGGRLRPPKSAVAHKIVLRVISIPFRFRFTRARGPWPFFGFGGQSGDA